jgi:hypothetical protein
VLPSLKVSLISTDDQKTILPSSNVGDKLYFHAKSEASFCVKYNIAYPTNSSSIAYEKLLVKLKLDGEGVGTREKVSFSLLSNKLSQSGSFNGFKKPVDDDK